MSYEAKELLFSGVILVEQSVDFGDLFGTGWVVVMVVLVMVMGMG